MGRCMRPLKLGVTYPGQDSAEHQVHNSASKQRGRGGGGGGGASQGINTDWGVGENRTAQFSVGSDALSSPLLFTRWSSHSQRLGVGSSIPTAGIFSEKHY